MRKTDRAFALCGVAFFVTLIGLVVFAGSTPDSHDSAAKVTAFYAKHHSKYEAVGFLMAIPAAFLALFTGALRQRLRRLDGGSIAATTAAVAGGTIASAGLMVFGTMQIALADAAHHVSAASMQTLNVIQSNSFEPAIGGFGVLLLGAGIATLQTRALPRALGYIAIVLGVLVFTPIGWFAFLASLLWTVVTSVIMAVRPARSGAGPEAPAVVAADGGRVALPS